VYRQEAGDADLVLVAYAAASHGTDHVRALVEHAQSEAAPAWRRLCIVACDYADQAVTRQDVAILVASHVLCSVDRLGRSSELSAKLSEWIRATLGQSPHLGTPSFNRQPWGSTDADPINREGEAWSSEWI
jgi:hypothetical protein